MMAETTRVTTHKESSGRIGYVVLTEQPAGGYQPDWDGELHGSITRAEQELRAAARTCGHALLAEVRLLATANTEGDK